MGTPVGSLELCGKGRQGVAPPSIHPTTGNAFQVKIVAEILQVEARTHVKAVLVGYNRRLRKRSRCSIKVQANLSYVPHYPSKLAEIRTKITQLQGKDFKGVKPLVPMKQHAAIEQYLERNPVQVVTMNFSVSENSSPQIPQNEKRHRLRRLNLATLKSNCFTLVAQLSAANPITDKSITKSTADASQSDAASCDSDQ